MWFNLLFVIFVVATCLNYMFLDIKVDKIKKESLDKDKVIGSLMAHNKALCKLNAGFKDHERRINDIEERLSSGEKHFELHKEPEYTCKDCKYYHALSGVGFTGAINFGFSNGISHFKCERMDCTYPIECNKSCQAFEKKESLDKDENVIYYANGVKININPYEDLIDRISQLYLDGGISCADANVLLEKLKQ